MKEQERIEIVRNLLDNIGRDVKIVRSEESDFNGEIVQLTLSIIGGVCIGFLDVELITDQTDI